MKLMIRGLIFVLVTVPHMAFAASEAELERLYHALGTNELIEILREEGMAQSDDMRMDMFPTRSASAWQDEVGSIYDSNAMKEQFQSRFNAELADVDVMPLLEYLETAPGTTIIRLEIDARRALMDEGIEEVARGSFELLKKDDPQRADQLRDFVDANNLVDLNVSGSLNSNLSFYQGLASGGGFEMDESEILADVWNSAEEVRADTISWVFGYLTLAYGPLSDEELDSYIVLSRTPAGKDLNRALFAAFDEVFGGISYAYGAAASRFTQGEDI